MNVTKRSKNKMKKNLPKIAIGFTFFVLFVIFSYFVHKDLFTQIDFNTTVRLQDKIPRRVDELFSIFSLIGTAEIAGIFLLVLLAIKRKLSLILTLPAFIALHVFELFGKTFVDHLPPPHFLLRTEKLVDLPQFYMRLENSYPSGHSARTAFISAILIILFAKSKKLSQNQKLIAYIAIGFYDVIMFTSRIYLGEHWLSDVIGGILLGASLGLISLVFVKSKDL